MNWDVVWGAVAKVLLPIGAACFTWGFVGLVQSPEGARDFLWLLGGVALMLPVIKRAVE